MKYGFNSPHGQQRRALAQAIGRLKDQIVKEGWTYEQVKTALTKELSFRPSNDNIRSVLGIFNVKVVAPPEDPVVHVAPAAPQ